MNRIGITGSRHGMTEAQAETFVGFLAGSDGWWLHHGCCVGADERAHWLAFEMGIGSVGHPPKDDRLMMDITGEQTFIELYPAKPYHIRNRDIVEQCDYILAFPADEVEQDKGGTWYTIRYARTCGRYGATIWPNGSITTLDAKATG